MPRKKRKWRKRCTSCFHAPIVMMIALTRTVLQQSISSCYMGNTALTAGTQNKHTCTAGVGGWGSSKSHSYGAPCCRAKQSNPGVRSYSLSLPPFPPPICSSENKSIALVKTQLCNPEEHASSLTPVQILTRAVPFFYIQTALAIHGEWRCQTKEIPAGKQSSLTSKSVLLRDEMDVRNTRMEG